MPFFSCTKQYFGCHQRKEWRILYILYLHYVLSAHWVKELWALIELCVRSGSSINQVTYNVNRLQIFGFLWPQQPWLVRAFNFNSENILWLRMSVVYDGDLSLAFWLLWFRILYIGIDSNHPRPKSSHPIWERK